MRDLLILRDFSSVAPGAIATLDIPRGPNYHGIILEYKRGGALATQAQIEAEIGTIKLKLNGKVQREFTPAQLFKILATYSQPIVAGYIYIPFSEPWARIPLMEDGLSWNTNMGVESFQMTVEIKAASVTPELKASAEVSYEKQGIGLIKKIRSNTVTITKTGVTEYAPEIQPYDSYAAVHCFSSDINRVEVQTDRGTRFEANKPLMDMLYRNKGITPQAGVTSILFNQTGRTTDALPMILFDDKGNVSGQVKQYGIKFDMANAVTFTILSETIGRPD